MDKFNWKIFTCFSPKTKKHEPDSDNPPYSPVDDRDHEIGGVYMGAENPTSQHLDPNHPSTSQAIVHFHSPEVHNQLSDLQSLSSTQSSTDILPGPSHALPVTTVTNSSNRQADFVPPVPNNTPEHKLLEFSGIISVECSDL